MTDDELDLIASAYVDGEATPDEVALVERDPELLARVEALRSVGQAVGSSVPGPPSELEDRQLAAALAEFDVVMGDSGAFDAASSSGPAAEATDIGAVTSRAVGDDDGVTGDGDRTVVDLGRRRTRQRRTVEPRPVFPRWLAAAAAVVVIGGGLVFAASQVSESGDDLATAELETADEAATADAATSPVELDAGDELGGEDSAAAADDGDAARAAAPSEDEAAGDVATDADATESQAAAEAEAAEEADDGEGAVGEGADGGETTRDGLFANEPLLFFDTPPDPDAILDDLPERRVDLERSVCGVALDVPDGSELVAFLPIEVAGDPAELFVVADGDGSESGLIVDAECQPLLP